MCATTFSPLKNRRQMGCGVMEEEEAEEEVDDEEEDAKSDAPVAVASFFARAAAVAEYKPHRRAAE